MLTRANWRQHLLFIIICVLLTGVVFSRAVLSIATVLFVLFVFTQGSFSSRITTFFHTPILLLISALFFMPLISGIWSFDTANWLRLLATKLPLLLLPLAFAQGIHLTKEQWKGIGCFFLFIVLAGTVYSTIIYFNDPILYQHAYLKAKVLPTPMHGDHLRFSLLVGIAVLFSFFLFQKSKRRLHQNIIIVIIAWFVFYLHLLAARTGLLCLYFIISSVIVWYVIKKKSLLLSISLLFLLITLPFLAFSTLPTFKARFQYLQYDLTQVYYGHYTAGTTDGGRALSLKGGWQLLLQNPFGVGMGDISHHMNIWYDNEVSSIVSSDKLFPSSEWLVHGLIAGWAGILLFTIIICVPFFMQVRNRFWWCLLHAVLALSILFDTGLSTQFGVFMYAFFILMWWQYNTLQKSAAAPHPA